MRLALVNSSHSSNRIKQRELIQNLFSTISAGFRFKKQRGEPFHRLFHWKFERSKRNSKNDWQHDENIQIQTDSKIVSEMQTNSRMYLLETGGQGLDLVFVFFFALVGLPMAFSLFENRFLIHFSLVFFVHCFVWKEYIKCWKQKWYFAPFGLSF